VISDAIALIEFLRKNWQKYQTISALFDYDGKRIEGDEQVVVTRIQAGDAKDKWFYRITPIQGYVFIYLPTIPGSVYVAHGKYETDTNPRAELFRFVGNSMSTFQSGGAPNVLVDFIVVGYRPKDLLGKSEGV